MPVTPCMKVMATLIPVAVFKDQIFRQNDRHDVFFVSAKLQNAKCPDVNVYTLYTL